MTLEAALKVIARLKWCIRDQRRRLNDLKQSHNNYEKRVVALYDEIHRLRTHADRCCSCGNWRH